MTTLIVDYDTFMDDRMQNRLRFSVAHEIGHLVLHSTLIQGLSYSSVEEWVEAVNKMPRHEYSSLEFQAYEFAGRFLVPLNHLKLQLEDLLDGMPLDQVRQLVSIGDEARYRVAGSIAPAFQVSPDVLDRRLDKENRWPPPRV